MAEQDGEHALADSAVPDYQDFIFEFHQFAS
jgi:hypothetical protein